jgi:hypothetical protein
MKENSYDLFQYIIMGGLRTSTENSQYKHSRSVSQDANLEYSRFEVEVLICHYDS